MAKNPNDRGEKPKDSGQGSQGMGGQPEDDPRDLDRGGSGRVDDDRGGGTGPIPGAFGGGKAEEKDGGTPEL